MSSVAHLDDTGWLGTRRIELAESLVAQLATLADRAAARVALVAQGPDRRRLTIALGTVVATLQARHHDLVLTEQRALTAVPEPTDATAEEAQRVLAEELSGSSLLEHLQSAVERARTQRAGDARG